MKKLISMVALAAISFGAVYAHPVKPVKSSVMQMDTTKKKKKTRDTTTKKDTTKHLLKK